MKRIILGKRLQQGILSLFIPAFVTTGGPVQANPGGGVVVHGAADIARMSANQLRIHQQTNNVVINWQNFSIGKGELTRFVQPNNGTALNRVTGGNISEIHGQLKGNANVYVINPNGIVVGSNGVIDVGGNAVLSTLDIDDDDFLNGGSNRFYGNSNTGVTNFGTISSASGDVVLMGGFVDNQGQIGALNGTVAIGAGGDILLEEGAGSKISVRGASDYTGTGINNTGTIRGASAELKAHGNVYALAINNGGAIRANGADRSSGRVLLRASGGSSNINLGAGSQIMATAGADGGQVQVDAGAGEAVVAGTIEAVGSRNGGSVAVTGTQVVQAASSVIDASGDRVGGSVALDSSGAIAVDGTVRANSSAGIGGDIAVTGETILINDSASLSADGHSAGGRIRVGGDFQGRDTGIREARSTRVEEGASLTADSLGGGHGGTAIVWANGDTLFLGEVSASSLDGGGNGGLVEVSGKEWLYFDGEARVGTVGGKAGTVLFDPGDVTIGAAGVPVPPLTSPVTDSTISISSINSTLQNGANVLVVTGSGNIAINSVGGGGDVVDGSEANNRDSAIQWTNSLSSFGAFASGSILVGNHIRTSGGGSINLLGGWGGSEGDAALQFDPQSAWDFYVGQGNFGNNGGSVFIGSSNMTRHVEVGSRFGDTNVAGFDVRVIGSDTAANNRYAMIGFHDAGQVFAPRLNRGTDGGAIQIRLDMKVGAPEGNGAWLLSDGRNSAGQVVAGAGDPIVAVAGQNEVDLNGDGVMDGVRGINSTGVVSETFIPYASHFNSATAGNWWWQQIEDAGSAETRDPLNLGGLRPEYGAGVGAHSIAALALGRPINGADINVLAKGSVVLQAGSGNESVGASIGHGGPNRNNNAGNGISIRDVGNEAVNNAAFSNAGVEAGQMERRWSFNGAESDRVSISGARLAPVYGNINVYAGVNGASPINVNHSTGKVTATVGTAGDVVLRAAQVFDTAAPSSNSSAQIGHGGIGQFGEYFGDIHVEAGRSVTILAGEATRATATIGHTTTGHVHWDPTSVLDQQLRFFATTSDFDNPNLRRGELFSGVISTEFNPAVDPARNFRFTLGNGFADFVPNPSTAEATSWTFSGNTNGGNFVPERNSTTGQLTGRFINVNIDGGTYAARTDAISSAPVSLQVIYMNPLLYTQALAGAGTHAGGNATSQGRAALGSLQLSPNGSVTVEALNGSTLKGFHGNINVFARSGDIVVKGYQTEGISGRFPRDRRFAGIGHGGSAFEANEGLGPGYRNILGTPTVPTLSTTPNGRENVSYRMNVGSETATGSSSYIGDVGGNMNRHLTFMSISGDINVGAGGNITVMGGNDVLDYARIGHGGTTLADFETSSFILGDIQVVAGGNVDVVGGGSIQPYARGNTDPNNGENNYDLLAPAHIGHGGYRAGFMGYLGDISVTAGGSIVVRNGAFSLSHGKIGHQGNEDRGQVGGNFNRLERFRKDSVETSIVSAVDNSAATVTYAAVAGGAKGPVGVRDFFASGAGTLVEGSRNTANISVVAGGGVTVDHLQIGRRQPAERLAWTGGNLGQDGFNADSQGLGIRTRNSFAQIGHGGINTIAFQVNNTATNYQNKVGNISVVANGGNVEVKNGEGQHRWSRIGHGVGRGEVQNDSSDANFSRAIELAGNITVRASGDIRIDAAAAAENERPENTSSALGKPYTSEFNPAAIGHGGVENNTDLVVLGRGELMNGIGASSNVTAVAGGSLYVLGGLGVDTSFAQLGHGFSSDQGNDFSRRRGVPTGFAGDITVSVDGNVSIVGGPNAWSEQPSGLTDGEGRTVHGAFAAIGHGGYQLDAPSFGKIQVYVGNDLNVIAQRRTDPETTLDGASPYSIRNPTPGLGGVASAFNFAKIGHFSVENRGPVGTAPQTGDITVVVGRDAVLQGGITPDVDTQTIYGAFAQIGHGGPSIIGDLKGDITVLVKRNLSVIQGSETNFATGGGNLTDQALNNYAMIGNGDFLRDTGSYTPTGIAAFDNALQLFRQTARGFRDGNIVIAAGNNASFNGAMIGHLDPAKANIATTGNTQIAVSRLFPFFGGRGTLTAVNGTVFSSGGFGNGSQMQFFMPARSNNAMDATTRINERTVTFSEAPDNFAAPFNTSNGILAGRNDEVYLTPDLWWDQAGQAAAGNIPGGGVFPTDAISGQGGSLAMVNSPGGLRNLDSLAAGSLGGSAPLYRDLNGVSGSGLYTLYYDAIEFVSNTLPTQPTDPNIPIPVETFDFAGLFFNETYDAFFREEDLFGDGIGGYGDELYYTLGLFERDSETWEGAEAMTFEDRLDNLFGERRDSNTQEEEDEEEENRRKRGRAGGPVGMTFYVFEPGTNRYSSYRVFGNQVTTFYPAN